MVFCNSCPPLKVALPYVNAASADEKTDGRGANGSKSSTIGVGVVTVAKFEIPLTAPSSNCAATKYASSAARGASKSK